MDRVTNPHVAVVMDKVANIVLKPEVPPRKAQRVVEELACCATEAGQVVAGKEAIATSASWVWEDNDFPANGRSLYRNPSNPPNKGDTSHVDLHSWSRLTASETLYGNKRPLKKDSGLVGMLAMRNMEQGEVARSDPSLTPVHGEALLTVTVAVCSVARAFSSGLCSARRPYSIRSRRRTQSQNGTWSSGSGVCASCTWANGR